MSRLALFGLWAVLAGPLAADALSLSDLFELEWATDPQIAPAGDRIVYVRNFMDRLADRRRSHLWIVDSDGSNHRPLTSGEGSYRWPRFSPDGSQLAYLGGEGGVAQLFVRALDAAEANKVTRLRNPPRNLVWSPDSRQIAFLKFVPVSKAPLTTLPAKPEGAAWAPPPRVIDGLVYRADGRGYLRDGYHHLFVVSAAGGNPRQLTAGDYNLSGAPAWLPDGSALVVAGNRRDDWEREPLNSELYEVDLNSGRITALTDRPGPDVAPVVSPDGTRVAYLGFDDRLRSYQRLNLYLLDRGSGRSRMIETGLDRSIGGHVWDSRGQHLFLQYQDHGRGMVGRAALHGGVVPRVQDLGGTSLARPYGGGSFSVARDGTIAYVRAAADRPADVAVLRGAETLTVTSLNEDLLAHRDLADLQALTWESSVDQRAIQGWLLLPPDFDPKRRYPLILEVHGGPFQHYEPRFAAELQLYAAAGYVVLFANPRGSTGYGEGFADLIHHNYPGQDADDLLSGVDAAIELGFVDSRRLFITGSSGGGTIASWILGRSDRFQAAAVQEPVVNWTSFVLTTDNPNFFAKYWFPDLPWRVPEHYWRRSPLALVDAVRTPTMLLTGEADYRTPTGEAEQYYQALRLRGVDSVLVRFPGASHGISARPSQIMTKVAYVLAWFARHPGLAES